ncbi:hypothetical protein BGZ98_006816 [Dissophora globulifera]|nr:hypothetical protein BGZ98_006816 [Dissophora globulifera]
MAEFKLYLASKTSSAGPDLILNVSEYATFLPRPFGFKDRSTDRSPSLGSGAINNKNNIDWVAPPSPPRTMSGYAAGIGPLLGPIPPKKTNDYQMIIKLPAMASPTIPTWTLPPRPVMGGKQPGKVPAVPPHLGASSDESSSDSDEESERHTSPAESEGFAMSETDVSTRRKSIGRKTAQRRNSKVGDVSGKRFAGSASERLDDSSMVLPQYCCLLSHEEARRLPRRFGDNVFSKSPAIVKINVPSFLLPELHSRLEALRATKKPNSATTAAGSTLSTDPSLTSHLKSKFKKGFSDNERAYVREKSGPSTTKRHSRHSSDSDSGSNSDSDRSDSKLKRSRPSFSPAVDKYKDKAQGRRSNLSGKDDGSQFKESHKDRGDIPAKRSGIVDTDSSIRRMRSESDSPPSQISSKRQKKEPKDDTRGDSVKQSRSSRDHDGRRSGKDGDKFERMHGSKQRTRGYSRSRSRSHSRSRSPKRSYDRIDGLGSRSGRDRRSHDDDRGFSKSKRKHDPERGHYDKSTKGRRDRSRSRSTDLINSRERSRDRKRKQSRSRSRERSSRKRDNEWRAGALSSAVFDNNTKIIVDSQQPPLGSKQASERWKLEGNRGATSGMDVDASPPLPLADSRQQRNIIPKALSIDSLDNAGTASAPTKKFSSEDQLQKRLDSNVNTPKAAADSPALSSARSNIVGRPTDNPAEATRRMSVVSSEPVSGGHTKYYREYRRYHALAVSLKRKADEITRIQHNPRLGAIVYFLSGNAFLRAFHLNDRHFEVLHANRPDLVQKESMKCWSSMRQFSTALSVQCRDKFQGLDGVSYLLEALVYFKCHMYSSYRLRQDLQAIEQFRNPQLPKESAPSKDSVPSKEYAPSMVPPSSKESSLSKDPVLLKESATTDPAVTITTELASRLLQNAEDWANLSTKLVDCEVALTPDVARDQFPETFKKWCIHPDDIGRSPKGFSTVVEQKRKVVDELSVQEEKVRKYPKIQWPLGTYMSLGNLMDFAEEALQEYQARNGLEYDVSTLQ